MRSPQGLWKVSYTGRVRRRPAYCSSDHIVSMFNLSFSGAEEFAVGLPLSVGRRQLAVFSKKQDAVTSARRLAKGADPHVSVSGIGESKIAPICPIALLRSRTRLARMRGTTAIRHRIRRLARMGPIWAQRKYAAAHDRVPP